MKYLRDDNKCSLNVPQNAMCKLVNDKNACKALSFDFAYFCCVSFREHHPQTTNGTTQLIYMYGSLRAKIFEGVEINLVGKKLNIRNYRIRKIYDL